MLSQKYSSVVFIIILLFGIIPFTAASDCDTLLSAYYFLKGSLLEDILLYKDCCNAVEITCDDSAHITEIIIEDFKSPEGDIGMALKTLASLNYLTKLKIKNTKTKTGLVIPNEIGEYKNLKSLNLGNNKVDKGKPPGAGIPESIGKLTNLKELRLYGNELIGTIPKEIAKLSNLEILDLEDNELTGTIPYKLHDLTNLKELDLKDNKELKGYIPLIDSVYTCSFGNTNLCYLKSTGCKGYDTEGCTIQEIQATNKENGASDLSIYESEVVTNTKNKFSKYTKLSFIFIYIGILAGICSIGLTCTFIKKQIKNAKFKKALEMSRSLENNGINNGIINNGNININKKYDNRDSDNTNSGNTNSGNTNSGNSNCGNSNCGNVSYNYNIHQYTAPLPSTQYTQPTGPLYGSYAQPGQFMPSSQYVPPTQQQQPLY